MDRIKVWPHMTIIAVAVAIMAGVGVAFWLKHQQTASAEELPYAARIQRVDGEVAFSDAAANGDENANWTTAAPNQPFSVGDRIYTRENSRTSLAFSGRNFARLAPNTSLDVVSLGDRRTQLALREGSAIFDVGYLQPDEVFEVGTPYGAVNFDEPGLYDVGFDNNGGVLVSVLSGLAQVAGLGGSGDVSKGEVLTLLGQAASELVLSRLNNDDAGYLVDDYYRYQYPDSYDGRYSSYDAYLNDPHYYDPYRRNASYQYASSAIPGIHDLDHYGDWQNVDGYGYAWRPRVDESWVPYQQGQWVNDYPYGPTWVSNEPWGYAPYHYGRWANVGNQWYWIPEGVNTTPAYAPALVGFVPFADADQIGWVPLGPGDVYAPHYYDQNWQPQYLTRANLHPTQLINLGVPGAVTAVPVDSFGRVVDRRNLRRIERERLASVRSTLDPLTLTPLRNAVVHSAWGRGKIDLPPGIAKKLHDTPVYVGRDVRDSRFRRGVAKSMRVERVSDDARGRKYKVRDERQDREQSDQARQQENNRRSDDARKVNQEAQQQARQLEQQQRGQAREQARVQASGQARGQARDEAKANREQERSNRRQEAASRGQGQQRRVERQAQQQTQPRAVQQQQRQPRTAPPQPQGQRVANPTQPHPTRPQPRREPKEDALPRPQAQPKPERGGGKADRQQTPPAQRGNQENPGGGGGGKGKGKGKP